MRRLLGIVLVFAAVTACGGGGSGASTKDDQNIADVAVLKGADLPSGFIEKASSSSSSSDSSASEESDACYQQATGQDPKAFDRSRTAKTKANFEKGQGLDAVRIEAIVEMLQDPKVISDQLAAFAKPEVGDCLKNLFTSAASSSSATISDTKTNFVPLDGVGDAGGTFTLTATLTAAGVHGSLTLELDLVKKGRAALSVAITTFDVAPDHDLAVSSIKLMASRIP